MHAPAALRWHLLGVTHALRHLHIVMIIIIIIIIVWVSSCHVQRLITEGCRFKGVVCTCVGDDAHSSKAVRLCGVGGKARKTCTARGSSGIRRIHVA